MFMYSYDPKSETAIALARALGLKMIKHVDSKFKGSHDKRVLNWGCSDLPLEVRRSTVINREDAVYRAINKRISLQILQAARISTVPWTSDIDIARELLNLGHRVFARTKVTGHDGDGLVEVTSETIDATPCRLWTKLVPSEKEYRVNVVREYDHEFNDYRHTICFQRKVPLDDFTGTLNPAIKTTANGYGFKFVTRNIPNEVRLAAMCALDALNLDFGGVDVLWTGTEALVLEVNTAPQLTPRAMTTLLPSFKRLMGIDE